MDFERQLEGFQAYEKALLTREDYVPLQWAGLWGLGSYTAPRAVGLG